MVVCQLESIGDCDFCRVWLCLWGVTRTTLLNSRMVGYTEVTPKPRSMSG